jgi:hypothetical protein
MSKPLDSKLWLSRSMSSLQTCQAIWNYYLSHEAEFVDKDWNDFIAALRKRFLKSNWHETLRMDMTRRAMKKDDNFIIWIEDLIHLNNRLKDIPSRFSEEQFMMTIGSNVCRALYTKANKLGAYDTRKFPTIDAWQAEMNRIEEDRLEETAHFKEIAKSLQPIPDTKSSSSHNNATTSFSTSKSTSSSFAYTPTWVPLYYPTRPKGNSKPISATARSFYTTGSGNPLPPKLSDQEQKILDDNFGCRKCRRVNAESLAAH